MDHRVLLKKGARLAFSGMNVEIESVVGAGSNAVVYRGFYEDGLNEGLRHTVLIKELYPYHPKGLIARTEDGRISVAPEAEDFYLLHKRSFERGNAAHLTLLNARPDLVGGNVNTVELNGTLYTMLSESGGRELLDAPECQTLKALSKRMLLILDALNAFHAGGLLHLDISPDNILILGQNDTERAMLIDYNSVFSADEIAGDAEEYFSVKIGYTAPEIVNRSNERITYATDLYSVMAVFYRMLAGKALSMTDMLKKAPPDVSNTPLLKDAPDTVTSYVKSMLKKGLCALSTRRYQSVEEVKSAFIELANRIDCLGVTHASLWEAGKRSLQALIKANPFYKFLSENDKMYPIRLKMEDDHATIGLDEALTRLFSEGGRSIACVSPGGMGKTTLLLKTALTLSQSYSPQSPAFLYASLAGRKIESADMLMDIVLENLRFTADTITYDGARHALKALLSSPLRAKTGEAPVLALLLDGLNEDRGDGEKLTDAIVELSRLNGVRLMTTSRAENERLPFEKAAVAPLEQTDIAAALAARGLLLPQNEGIRKLLKTPLLLSAFIEASEDGRQLNVASEEELMQKYIESLAGKEMRMAGEDETHRLRVEVAVKLVLPVLSHEAARAGGTLTGQECERILKKLRKTLLSPNMSRAFPEWIGHKKQIVAANEDEWYGEMVNDILRRRMGLLIRSVGGSVCVSHARIAEHLALAYEKNEKRLKKRRIIRDAAISCAAIIVLALVTMGTAAWARTHTVSIDVKKTPYPDDMAEKSMSYVVSGYAGALSLNDEMVRLVNEAGDPEAFRGAYDRALSVIQKAAGGRTNALMARYVNAMLDTEGKVISWSNAPFDGANAVKLLEFAGVCAQEYEKQLPVYRYWLENEKVRDFYSDYPSLFMALLEADRKYAAQMYQAVKAPHMEGRPEVWLDNERKLIAMYEDEYSVRQTVTGEEAAQLVQNAQSAREKALTRLRKESEQIARIMKEEK